MGRLKKILAVTLSCILAVTALTVVGYAEETSSENDINEGAALSLAPLIKLADHETYTVTIREDGVDYAVSFDFLDPAISGTIRSTYIDYQLNKLSLDEYNARISQTAVSIVEDKQNATRIAPERQTIKNYTYSLMLDDVNLYTAEVTVTGTYSDVDNYAQIDSIEVTSETGEFKDFITYQKSLSGSVGVITFISLSPSLLDGQAFMGATYEIFETGHVEHNYVTIADDT